MRESDAVYHAVDGPLPPEGTAATGELANEYLKPYRIALTGGMACIPGTVAEFERRLSAELDRDVGVVVPDEPDLAAADGVRRIAERLAGR